MAFFKYRPDLDAVRPLTARDADRVYWDTDAGITNGSEPFIVQAPSALHALDGARRWLACWADEDETSVPDDLMLEERHYRPGKTYMTLRVL